MATPYFQLRLDSAPSTQDVARERLDELPVLVVAPRQEAGRGRSGSGWLNADRALAASLAFRVAKEDERPFSLMAGVAAARVVTDTMLKWPNDLMLKGSKAGGVLVERSGGIVVVGFGLNLWWQDPPEGMTAIYQFDPGGSRHAELGGLWAAELMRLLEAPGWPRGEYLQLCTTIGRRIAWEPEGVGVAVDVADDGGLVVESEGSRQTIYSGAVQHLRQI